MSTAYNPQLLTRAQWHTPTSAELANLEKSFQRRARHRGKLPDKVLVMRDDQGEIIRSAIQYIEVGFYERWAIQNHPLSEIRETWSIVLSWLRPLIGDKSAFEVYPPDSDIVDTTPCRWFWVFPNGVPGECNLSHT